MVAVLITGMSGTGKSAVLSEPGGRGHRVADLDDLGWAVDVPLPDGSGVEQLWREDLVSALLDGHDDGRMLFLGGCSRNQASFYDRLDAVVLLRVPREVLLHRIATRTMNPFGRSALDRQRVLDDIDAVEPLLRVTSTLQIDTIQPLSDVVDQVEALALRLAERH